MMKAVGLLIVAVAPIQGFHHIGGSLFSARKSELRMSAIDSFAASQEETLSKVLSAVPEIASKPDLCLNGESIAGGSATLKAFDAPGPPNIAWVSSLTHPSMCSLTILNGPLNDVPHLVSRAVVVDQTLSLYIDWKPRCYGGYDQVLPDGSYPGPDVLGREAFVLSSNRDSMSKKFYDSLSPLLDSLSSFEGAQRVTSVTEAEQLVRGPVCVDLQMPLTDANVQTAIKVRSQAAEAWVDWQADPQHAHKPGAPVNTQYVYDSKAKINMYNALKEYYTQLFNDDGIKLAAADSGPLDEAYVGGGS